MKVKVFGTRKDEIKLFEKFGEKYGHELSLEFNPLSLENVELAKGFKGISILGDSAVDKEVLGKLAEFGVKFIASRAPRVNNIDFETAAELGFKISNVPAVSTNAVSEFVLMSALTLLRNLPEALFRVKDHNTSLDGLLGKEIRNQTVGVIGTGRIGREVARVFNTLGAKVVAYDMYPDKATKEFADYLPLEEILKQSDIVSLHCSLTEETHHMINADSIATMKDNAIIINSASGGLIEINALKDALASGKIAGVALDMYENEDDAVLKDFTNVIMTPHYAYYTDEAVANMVVFSLDSLQEFEQKGYSNYEVAEANN